MDRDGDPALAYIRAGFNLSVCASLRVMAPRGQSFLFDPLLCGLENISATQVLLQSNFSRPSRTSPPRHGE